MIYDLWFMFKAGFYRLILNSYYILLRRSNYHHEITMKSILTRITCWRTGKRAALSTKGFRYHECFSASWKVYIVLFQICLFQGRRSSTACHQIGISREQFSANDDLELSWSNTSLQHFSPTLLYILQKCFNHTTTQPQISSRPHEPTWARKM